MSCWQCKKLVILAIVAVDDLLSIILLLLYQHDDANRKEILLAWRVLED